MKTQNTPKPTQRFNDFAIEIQDLTPGTLPLVLQKLRELHPDISDVRVNLQVSFYSTDSQDEARVMGFLNEGFFTYERK